MSACFKFKEPFEFKPQLKLWLSTQHAEIVGTDEGIWATMTAGSFRMWRQPGRDHSKRPAAAEAKSDARWAIKGYGRWSKHGLMEPEMVLNATTEYRAEEDVLLRFIHSDY